MSHSVENAAIQKKTSTQVKVLVTELLETKNLT